MKVKDLIAVLQTYDPEMDVVMDARSDGVDTADDIDVPAKTRIVRNQSGPKEYWRGRHDYARLWDGADTGEEVVVIVRKR